MPDNKSVKDYHDRDKIDINDTSEVEYLHKQWKQFSHEQIKEAIKRYGPHRNDVENYLKKHGAAE